MKANSLSAQRASRIWLTSEACDIEEFTAEVERRADPAQYPLASMLVSNVPIYNCDAIRAAAGDPDSRKALMAEWAWAMREGSGIVVFRKCFDDLDPVDAVTRVFFQIIDEQRRENKASGDHFAKPGANDRVWNALEKLALRDPQAFARYYANDVDRDGLAGLARNGLSDHLAGQLRQSRRRGAVGASRLSHGLSDAPRRSQAFPLHAHQLSPFLTLQGAVAHCDMPIESGPTLYLPFSQTFAPGYFAYRRPEFAAYFDEHHVQLAARQGRCGVLQSRAVPRRRPQPDDRRAPHRQSAAGLLAVWTRDGIGRSRPHGEGAFSRRCPPRTISAPASERNVIAASAEGYAFPTNLDRDPPIGGLAPQSQAQLMAKALAEGWTPEAFGKAVDEHAARRLT